MAAQWKSKTPEEMSLEELAKAKQELSAKFSEVQEEFTWLQSAIVALDFQVGQRFALNSAPIQYAGQVPAYPIAQVQGKKPEDAQQ